SSARVWDIATSLPSLSVRRGPHSLVADFKPAVGIAEPTMRRAERASDTAARFSALVVHVQTARRYTLRALRFPSRGGAGIASGKPLTKPRTERSKSRDFQ